MRTYIDAFFRRPVLLAIPVVIGLVAGATFALLGPRTYTSISTIWFDRVPGPSSLTDPVAPAPAVTQAALLTQLLATRSFVESVIGTSTLANDFDKASPQEAEAIIVDVASSIQVLTPGTLLMSLAVTREDPREALALSRSVIGEFERSQIDQARTRAEAQLSYNTDRLRSAKLGVQESPKSVSARDLLERAQDDYNRSLLDLAGVESAAMQNVEYAEVATPGSRRKALVLGAGGGLLAGLTLSLLTLIVMMARDDTVRSQQEDIGDGLAIIGTVPRFSLPNA